MFTYTQKVLFKHCDPAGIVFYPRYYEMLNDCVEEFFSSLGFPFEDILRDGGVPTAHIETQFLAPSRHGDILQINQAVTKVGTSSLDLSFEAVCEGEARFSSRSTLVYVNEKGRPRKWPADISARLSQHLRSTK